MKKIVIIAIALCMGNTLMAQTTTIGEELSDKKREKNVETAKELYEEDASDVDFKIMKANKDYSQESAVILCAHTYYNCEVQSYITINELIHKRILLQDKKAVEEFATIKREIVGEDGNIAIKVIKPNGDTKFYCINDALATDDKDKVRDYSLRIGTRYIGPNNTKTYKIALGNLEIGDIVDFIVSDVYKYDKIVASTLVMPNYYYSLQGDEPIVKQKLSFYLHKNFLLSFKSVNGAGQLKEDNIDDRKYRSFSFVDSNRESIKNNRWLFSRREVPMIKFAICNKAIASNYLDYSNFYNEDIEDAKIVVNKEIIKEKLERYFKKASPNYADIKSTTKSIVKKYNDNTENKDALMKILYYNIKSKICFPVSYTDGSYTTNNLIKSSNFYSLKSFLADRMNSLQFVYEMITVMNYYDIPGSIVIAPDRSSADLNNVAFLNELVFAIKYKDNIIYAPNGFSNMNDGYEFVEGQTGFEVIANEGDFSEIKSFKEFVFPVTTNDVNVSKSTLIVNIDETNFEKLRVSDSTYYYGLPDEYKIKYFTSLDYTKMKNKNDKVMKVEVEEEEDVDEENLSARKAEAYRKTKEMKSEIRKELLNSCKKGAKESFPSLLEIDTAKIINIKSNMLETDISVDYNSMVLGDLIKKIGSNYAIEIGKVIGSQIDLKQKEKQRDFDIWIDYAKEYQNVIRLKIPSGYKAEGLDNLNFNVDNSAGAFISKANMVGNEVVITTSKKYKKNFMPKEEWASLSACLDAAFNFTQKKLILKKL